ncbi:ankyrin repeat-containing domain protein [Aspergillus lucknowensis]|uniref:Ankyrin repeat-containing domain protein n=1 Tax=Aspergillus lucknowensis TaxID=176173 RepID=A0ABR4LNI0_9EURO
MDGLLGLPNEILLDIAARTADQELGRLTRTCWRLHHLLNPLLYRRGLQPHDDKTTLSWAAETRNHGTIARVFQYTEPPQHALSDALLNACHHYDPVSVRLLLDHGASPHGHTTPPSSADRTPLFTAAIARSRESVHLLLQAGAIPGPYTVEDLAHVVARSTDLKIGPDDDQDHPCEGRDYDPEIMRLLVRHGLDVRRYPSIIGHASRLNCSVSALGFLLELGLDPNARDENGRGALHQWLIYAREKRHGAEACAAFVSKCIEHGAQVNDRDGDGSPVLTQAITRQLPATFRALIAAGADINIRDEYYGAPLYAATLFMGGNTERAEMVRALLDAGADVNAEDNVGRRQIVLDIVTEGDKESIRLVLARGLEQLPDASVPQLILAAAKLGDAQAMQQLLDADGGQDTQLLHAQDIYGNTALMFAALAGHDDVIRCLIPLIHGVTTWQNRAGDSALHLAMYSNKESTARLLGQFPGCWRMYNRRCYHTPLALAVQYQSPGVVEYGLNEDSDILAQDFQGKTLLHHAVERGDPEIVKLLLERDAPCNMRDNAQQTPLTLAVYRDREDLVQLFLDRGEPVEQRDGKGQTLLMIAVLRASVSMVRRLVAAGAQLGATSDGGAMKGATALVFALENEEQDITDFLVEAGADVTITTRKGQPLLLRAIGRRWSGVALRMLRMHAAEIDIEAVFPPESGRTALTCAAGQGLEDVVLELLQLGANAHHRDSEGHTPLFWAARQQTVSVISLLLEYMSRASGFEATDDTALLNIEDSHGNTPLLLASQGYLHVFEWLVARGADIHHRNHAGKTAAALAAEDGRVQIVNWLRSQGLGVE